MTEQTTDPTFAERMEAKQDELVAQIEALEKTITQREWLLIVRALDFTREQIQADGPLRLLALAFIREKRAHGGADWDRLLDMTDDEILKVHGIDPEALEAELHAQDPGPSDDVAGLVHSDPPQE